MITLYLNAVMEMVKMSDEKDVAPDMEFLIKYIPHPRLFPPPSIHNADMLRFCDARSFVLNVNKFFERLVGNGFRMEQ